MTLVLVVSFSSTAIAVDANSDSEYNDLIQATCCRYNLKRSECTYQAVADYITDELGKMSEIFELAYPESSEVFSASYVEYRIPVYMVSDDVEGIYLDFDGENGYMILSENYDVIVWKATGDLPYLRELQNTYYSVFDGFGYYVDEQFVPYETHVVSEEELSNLELTTQYAGQNSAGDGDIYDPDKYVAAAYGDGYVVKSGNSKSLPFSYFGQYDLSIYYQKKSDGRWYSEGNCSLSSIFALLNYLKTSGKYTSLPSAASKTSYNATQDSFYSKYSGNTSYRIDTPKSLPKLYLAVRQYAVKHYGYETGGTNPFNITTIIEKVAAQYGASVDAKHIVVWSYESQVVDEIDAGYPVIINVANSSTYGSHTMVVTGYRLYTKTTKVLGINFYSYAKLIQVNDNWTRSARYFDFTNYVAFGSFVTVR